MATSGDVVDAIRRRHGLGIRTANGLLKGALVEECGINLGLDFAQRRADAIVLEYTGQRRVIGYEIKISRADWLRELADPTKSEWWSTRCHEWWIATAPNVVRPGEVPQRWGHVELRKTRLYTRQTPQRIGHGPPPQPDIDAMRSITRKLHHTLETP